jgi:hypothetical protein
VEVFFNKIKHDRRITSQSEKPTCLFLSIDPHRSLHDLVAMI